MAFKNPFRRVQESKQSSAAPVLAAFGAHQPRFTPRRYDQLAKEGFQGNVIAYRCIRLISQSAALVPWRLFSGAVRLEQHPLLELLHRPNPQQAGSAFFDALCGYYLIAGNSYIEAVAPQGGTPKELWCLRPDRMQIIAGAQGVPEAYRYQANGQYVDFAVERVTGRSRVLHLKAFHPLDDWYGLSPLEAAATAVDQHNDAAKWNASLLQTGGRPSGALVYKPAGGDGTGTLSDEQRHALKRELEEYFTGAGNAGRPLVLEGGLDWREMALSPKDMDWLAGKDVSAREIALAFHVPPQLVGVEGSLTFANFEQARLALYDDAVLPLLDNIQDALNNWLTPLFGDGLHLAFDTDGIEALAPRREKIWERLSKAAFMTLNEKRAALGLSPMEGGDKL